MALTQVPTTRAGSRPTQEAAHQAVRELQGLKIAVVEGADDEATATLEGITPDDVLVGVLAFDPGTPALDAVEAEIVDEDEIQTGTDTSGMTLVVLYIDVA